MPTLHPTTAAATSSPLHPGFLDFLAGQGEGKNLQERAKKRGNQFYQFFVWFCSAGRSKAWVETLLGQIQFEHAVS